MAKQLKDILKQAHDTIKGVRPSTTDAGSTGKDPGVDYKPKAGDEDEFVAKHSVQKWDDPNGNEVDHYSKGIKYSLDTPQNARMGYKQKEAEKAEFKAVKEAKEKEDAQCNNSPKGTACPVHGLGECSSMKPIKEKAEQVDEVLTKSTTAGETIHDFVHSDNPKFKGKSKEKRKQMALAAYYAKQNEDTYPVQPLLGSADIAKNKTDDTQDEIDMVRTELKAIANKVMHMLASMPADHHIEPWVQAKIASAKEMIGSVHDYMMYSEPHQEDEEQMDTPSTFPNMSVDVNTGHNV
jgi:hypothetical protein